MASEMIERVAKALTMYLQPTVNIKIDKAAAIAAIQAMRIPTDTMLDVVNYGRNSPYVTWIKMIDAALKEDD